MWQFTRAEAPLRVAGNRALKLDGVNDHVIVDNNQLYDFSFSDFTLITRLFIVNLPNHARFIGKLTTWVGYSFIYFATGGSSLLFNVTLSNSSGKSVRAPIVLNNVLGRWVTFAARRKNQDGTLVAVNDINNLEIFIDGIKQNTTNYINNDTATDPALNTSKFTIGAEENLANPLMGYVGFAAAYRRALSEQELIDAGNGIFSPVATRGLWNMNEASGKVVPDSSSVQQHGVIMNMTDFETGIPDPSTNAVWIPEDAIFWYRSGTATTNTFAAASDLTIRKIQRFNSTALKVDYAHIRGGIVIASGTLSFSGNTAAFTLPMLQGDRLELAGSGHTTNCTLELFY